MIARLCLGPVQDDKRNEATDAAYEPTIRHTARHAATTEVVPFTPARAKKIPHGHPDAKRSSVIAVITPGEKPIGAAIALTPTVRVLLHLTAAVSPATPAHSLNKLRAHGNFVCQTTVEA